MESPTIVGSGEWHGFYDWLRNDTRMIIGVRFWPFDEAEFLLKVYPNSPRLLIDPSGAILIFFGPETGYCDAISDDQEFEYSAVYRTRQGEYSIAFGCSDLNKDHFSPICDLPDCQLGFRSGSYL